MCLVALSCDARPAWLLMGLAAGLTVVADVDLAALEPVTDPAVALAKLQSGQGGTLRLEFDGVLALPETVSIKTNTVINASGYHVTLDGETRVRHFVVETGATLRLINLTLINGRSTGVAAGSSEADSAGVGGAILNTGGTLELIDCAFINNQAIGANGGPPGTNPPDVFAGGTRGGSAYGGAVYSQHGQVAVTNCLFASNGALGGLGAIGSDGYTGGGGDAFGGAIYCTNGQSILVGVTFTNNLAKAGEMSGGRPLEGGGSAYGGAVADETEAITIQGGVFIGNLASGATKVGSDTLRQTGVAKGGAVYHGSGTMSVQNTLLESNWSSGGLGAERGGRQLIFGDGKGGAIYTGGELAIQNSALVSNKASGGDIPPDCCSPSIAQAGSGEGGGIANEGALTVINCTFFENSATGGRAVSVGALSGPAYGGAVSVVAGAVSFLNVTVASNRTDVLSVLKGFGSSLSIATGIAACTNTILLSVPGQTNISGAIVDGGHNICSDESALFTLESSRNNLDPLLGPLNDNGGPTPTMMPLPASPAIDQGDASIWPPTDQRGFPRPLGFACDIGALEVAPRLTLARSTEGGIRLTHVFRAAQTSQIIISTNLLDWTPLATADSDADGVLQFEDTAAAEVPFRFYQIGSQPGQ